MFYEKVDSILSGSSPRHSSLPKQGSLLGRSEEEAKPVASCYASSIDSTRILVAKGIANRMRSQSFSDAA